MVLSKVSPIAWNERIVDEKGCITPYFERQLQQLLGEKAATDALADGAVQSSDLSDIISALELDDLADVTVPSPADNDVLKYSLSSGTWINGSETGGSGITYVP